MSASELREKKSDLRETRKRKSDSRQREKEAKEERKNNLLEQCDIIFEKNQPIIRELKESSDLTADGTRQYLSRVELESLEISFKSKYIPYLNELQNFIVISDCLQQCGKRLAPSGNELEQRFWKWLSVTETGY